LREVAGQQDQIGAGRQDGGDRLSLVLGHAVALEVGQHADAQLGATGSGGRQGHDGRLGHQAVGLDEAALDAEARQEQRSRGRGRARGAGRSPRPAERECQQAGRQGQEELAMQEVDRQEVPAPAQPYQDALRQCAGQREPEHEQQPRQGHRSAGARQQQEQQRQVGQQRECDGETGAHPAPSRPSIELMIP